jgi:hypothetical protein
VQEGSIGTGSRLTHSDGPLPYPQERTCPHVFLTSTIQDAYFIEKEIIVSRRVSVAATPATMPVISAQAAARAFRVKVRREDVLRAR